MAKSVHLKVITPAKILVERDTEMVVLRTSEGDMGVMAGHVPQAVIMGVGVLRIMGEGDDEERLAVLSGFAEIIDDQVIVLSDDAEWPEEIDRARAEAAKERAAKRIAEHSAEVDITRAELALRRALVRIEVSSYPLIKSGTKGK